MFATIPKSTLLAMQSSPRSVMPSRTTLSCLSCVRLTVPPENPFEIQLRATDLDLHLVRSFTLPEPAVGGSVLVPYREFSRLRPVGAAVHLFVRGDHAVFADTTGGPSYALENQPGESFPTDPPRPGDGATTVLGKDFFEALHSCLPFVSEDETRYVLCGVFATPADTVATCGRRLITIAARGPSVPIIIPTKACKALHTLFGTGATVHISPAGDYATFTAPGLSLHSRLILGNFPNYHQVIPSREQAAQTLTFSLPENVHDFLAKLNPITDRKAVRISRASRYAVRLHHPAGTLATPAAISGDFAEFGADPAFFASCLKAAGPTLHLIDPFSPVTFRSPTATAVCMPMRICAPEVIAAT